MQLFDLLHMKVPQLHGKFVLLHPYHAQPTAREFFVILR